MYNNSLYYIIFCIIFYIYCIILFILLYYILLQYIYLYTPTCLQSRFHHEIAVDNVYCPCFPSLAKRHSPSSALVVIVPPLDDLVTLCCNKSLGPIASDTKSSILPWMIHWLTFIFVQHVEVNYVPNPLPWIVCRPDYLQRMRFSSPFCPLFCLGCCGWVLTCFDHFRIKKRSLTDCPAIEQGLIPNQLQEAQGSFKPFMVAWCCLLLAEKA